MVDVLAGLIEFLLADSALYALAEQRVFGAEVPASEAGKMPRQAVVARFAGGGASAPGASDWTEHCNFRVDFFCYGETPIKAEEVRRAVHTAIKNLARYVTGGDVLLHSATLSGGPIFLRDPDTDWPLVFESWLLYAAECAVA